MIFSLAWNIIFTNNLKVLVLKFLEIKNMVFLSQKVEGNMVFTDYWKVLVFNLSVMGNTVFFWVQKLMKRWYLWLLRSSCFEPFGDEKYSLFFSQKIDKKMIFSWSFWAFYDIPGPGKYGFLRSDLLNGIFCTDLSRIV